MTYKGKFMPGTHTHMTFAVKIAGSFNAQEEKKTHIQKHMKAAQVRTKGSYKGTTTTAAKSHISVYVSTLCIL